jgi:hypothetical protein
MTHLRSWLAVGALTVALSAGLLWAGETNNTGKKKTCPVSAPVPQCTGTCTSGTDVSGSFEASEQPTKSSACAGCKSCTSTGCCSTCCKNCPTCAANASTSTVKVYNVSKLLSNQSQSSGKELIRVVIGAVEPQSWNCMGGAGAVEFFQGPAAPCLIVRQTPDVQEQVAQLLSALEAVSNKNVLRTINVGVGMPPQIAPAAFCVNGCCTMCGHGALSVSTPLCVPGTMPCPAPVAVQMPLGSYASQAAMPADVVYGYRVVPPSVTTAAPACCASPSCCASCPVMQAAAVPAPCCTTCTPSFAALQAAGVPFVVHGLTDVDCCGKSHTSLTSIAAHALACIGSQPNCSTCPAMQAGAVSATPQCCMPMPSTVAQPSDCRKCASAEYTLVVSGSVTPHADGTCENHLCIVTPSKGEVTCDHFSMIVAGQPVKVSRSDTRTDSRVIQLSGKDWNASANQVCLTADGKQLKLSDAGVFFYDTGTVMGGQNVTLNMTGDHTTFQVDYSQTPVMPASEACETPDTLPDPLAYMIWYGLFGSW